MACPLALSSFPLVCFCHSEVQSNSNFRFANILCRSRRVSIKFPLVWTTILSAPDWSSSEIWKILTFERTRKAFEATRRKAPLFIKTNSRMLSRTKFSDSWHSIYRNLEISLELRRKVGKVSPNVRHLSWLLASTGTRGAPRQYPRARFSKLSSVPIFQLPRQIFNLQRRWKKIFCNPLARAM